MATPLQFLTCEEIFLFFYLWFMIIVSRALISGIIFFSKIVDLPSSPQLEFGFSPLTTVSSTILVYN